MNAEKTVIEKLKNAGKPLKSVEIAVLAGIDKKVVDKAIKALKTAEKINSPKHCYYEAKWPFFSALPDQTKKSCNSFPELCNSHRPASHYIC